MASLNQKMFDLFDLPDLLINTWRFSEHVYHRWSPDPSSCTCKKYLQYCVGATREKWSDEYLHFDTVIYHLQHHDRRFEDFGKIPSNKKETIYDIIKEQLDSIIRICTKNTVLTS